MIPKIIHYCWFGGKPLPESVRQYIATWRKHMPDYEIKQWDETNFDVNALLYTRQAYYAGKFAFVSDVARLYALLAEGGIYLDTDIIIKKRIPDQWLSQDGFSGFEHDVYAGTGVIASSKGNEWIEEFFNSYLNRSFFKGFRFDITTNVNCFTNFLKTKGFVMNNEQQTINGHTLFPQIYLCGKDWIKGRYDDDSTFAVHDYAGTWGKPGLYHGIKMILQAAICIIKWKFSGRQ
ncbi:MAG: hypothetical protein NC301_09200 [Bacteroides sp.]|nr:hypothetical protein [Alistipes timonensis]MCM1311177.1 hypothetical protein [Bacteroides sp.]MCM1405574.1 glycosyl transferase [[Clostridium] fimetarium]